MKKKVIRLVEINYEDFKSDLRALRPAENKSERKAEEELLTLAETASFFKVSKRTLGNWHHHQILRKVEIGNRVYFRRKDIEELIQKNTL